MRGVAGHGWRRGLAGLGSVRGREPGAGPRCAWPTATSTSTAARRALAFGVIFGLAVALALWGLGWRELRS